jgi:hypothetical protein
MRRTWGTDFASLTSAKGTSEVHERNNTFKLMTNETEKMVEAAGVELITMLTTRKLLIL